MVRPMALPASMARPVAKVPIIASAWPNRMPGLRPYWSVMRPTGYDTRKRLTPNSPTVRPARLAEPVTAITISGPMP